MHRGRIVAPHRAQSHQVGVYMWANVNINLYVGVHWYRVAKTHRMPYLERSFFAKSPIIRGFLAKIPATKGILGVFATVPTRLVYVGIFAYTPVCMYTEVYTYMHVHLCVDGHIHSNVAYICRYCICRYICIYACMYIYGGIYIYACTPICGWAHSLQHGLDI